MIKCLIKVIKIKMQIKITKNKGFIKIMKIKCIKIKNNVRIIINNDEEIR